MASTQDGAIRRARTQMRSAIGVSVAALLVVGGLVVWTSPRSAGDDGFASANPSDSFSGGVIIGGGEGDPGLVPPQPCPDDLQSVVDAVLDSIPFDTPSMSQDAAGLTAGTCAGPNVQVSATAAELAAALPDALSSGGITAERVSDDAYGALFVGTKGDQTQVVVTVIEEPGTSTSTVLVSAEYTGEDSLYGITSG